MELHEKAACRRRAVSIEGGNALSGPPQYDRLAAENGGARVLPSISDPLYLFRPMVLPRRQPLPGERTAGAGVCARALQRMLEEEM